MLLVAHRTPGDGGLVAGLRAAGADVFELDVAPRRGGLVVSHYVAVPGTGGNLVRDNWRLRTGAAAARLGAAAVEPPLQDALAALPPGAAVLLDLKAADPAGRAQTVRLVRELDPGPRPVAVSSHHPDDLAALAGRGFAGWLSVGGRRALAAALACAPDATPGRGALPSPAVTVRHTLLDAATLARLHERYPAVIAWTVNAPRRAAELARLGVDGITTDRLEVLRLLSAGRHGAGGAG